jgi:hypothetical protein
VLAVRGFPGPSGVAAWHRHVTPAASGRADPDHSDPEHSHWYRGFDECRDHTVHANDSRFDGIDGDGNDTVSA